MAAVKKEGKEGSVMRGSIGKAFLLAASVILMLTGSPVGVSAKGTHRMPELETDRKGVLTVHLFLEDENGEKTDVEGVILHVFKAADLMVRSDGSALYTLTSEFAQTGIVFDGMRASESNQAAKQMQAVVIGKGLLEFSSATDKSGEASFADLEPGMYLVMQREGTDTDSQYSIMDPYLVSVPMGEMNHGGGVWNYEVHTIPKMEIVKKPGTEGGTEREEETEDERKRTERKEVISSAGSTVRTGDDTPLAVYMVFLVGAAVVLVLLAGIRVRRNKRFY